MNPTEIFIKAKDYIDNWAQGDFGIYVDESPIDEITDDYVLVDDNQYCLIGMCRKAALDLYDEHINIQEGYGAFDPVDDAVMPYLIKAIKKHIGHNIMSCVEGWNDTCATKQDITAVLHLAAMEDGHATQQRSSEGDSAQD